MENIKFEEAAFLLRTKRMELLASNIANADTLITMQKI
jgi:flagellar basal body rod protein FlgB